MAQLHRAATHFPQARGDLPQLFQTWFPDPWLAAGFWDQRGAPLHPPGCTEVAKMAGEPHSGIEAAILGVEGVC